MRAVYARAVGAPARVTRVVEFVVAAPAVPRATCATSTAGNSTVRRFSSSSAASPPRLPAYPPPPHVAAHAHVGPGDYEREHVASLADPEAYWAAAARDFTWFTPFSRACAASFDAAGGPTQRWFVGGETNITVNALDRHVAAGLGAAPALTFEDDEGTLARTYSYAEVLDSVCAWARVLEGAGVKRGDVVSIYLPMIPAIVFVMLACARLGAVHSVVFAGFSAEALASRIVDARSSVLVTADAGRRGGRAVPLKPTADAAVAIAAAAGVTVRATLVTHRAGPGVGPGAPGWSAGRDVDADAALAAVRAAAAPAAPAFPPARMGAEDALFLIYTSGSTGKPKGVRHSVGGYMVYAGHTFKHVFDARPARATGAAGGGAGGSVAPRGGPPPGQTVFFNLADAGWITGHTYTAYGPLLAGAHVVMIEGTPTHPGPDRVWATAARHRATVVYISPTATRALMPHGEAPVARHDLSALRVIGSVGEPINPEAWEWLHRVVGRGKTPIVDTYWQSETGGVVLTSFPGGTAAKPGAATKPYFGVRARVVRPDGAPTEPGESGALVIDAPWPGLMAGVHGDAARFKSSYFSDYPGRYFTGDAAVIDADGDIRVLGRTDDVINTSGHRLGTAEVESALATAAGVAESAVVGFPHPVKGEGVYAFVRLAPGTPPSPAARAACVAAVRKAIGAIASPDVVHFCEDLPKTRSGKLMRRICRKIAAGETEGFGDTSTLTDPHVVDALVHGRAGALAMAAAK